MTYQMCQLGTLTYPRNPNKEANPAMRSVGEVESLTGIVVQDWGFVSQDRLIVHQWDMMPASDYAAFNTLWLAGGTPVFTDVDGSTYTVFIKELTYDQRVASGRLYANVRLTLRVIV